MEGLPNLTEKYSTILADPPWRFTNRTGKIAPEHSRLRRYETMSIDEICAMPTPSQDKNDPSHLYLNSMHYCLGPESHGCVGFSYKANIVWYKVRKDGGPDGRGVGFYFRNVTELLLFGTRGKMRTLAPGRTQVNILATRKREHSRKPSAMYGIVERCSPGPFLELFAREPVKGWKQWGFEVDSYVDTRKVHPMYDSDETSLYTLAS